MRARVIGAGEAGIVERQNEWQSLRLRASGCRIAGINTGMKTKIASQLR